MLTAVVSIHQKLLLGGVRVVVLGSQCLVKSFLKSHLVKLHGSSCAVGPKDLLCSVARERH